MSAAPDPRRPTAGPPKRLAILGSTGSIGTQTLDVVRALPERFEIVALATGRPSELFADQVAEFRPRLTSLRNHPGARFEGARTASLDAIAADPEVDLVVVATPGGAGIGPTVAALGAGKPVALANKEALVAAGSLATDAAFRTGAPILPIDSEHSAIWQCLHDSQCVTPPVPPDGDLAVDRLILTASGGAFRDRPIDDLAAASAAEALKHPNWAMGPKVTIDSASLLNKGFELIEAHWLFGISFDRLAVLVHRESIVHSLVEFSDGSVKAQLGMPDMRLPIQYALTFPDRPYNPRLPRLDLGLIGRLTFADPEPGRYPCLDLAISAGRQGGTYPSVLGGADEAAVALFLTDQIQFGDIAALIADALGAHQADPNPELEAILRADQWARDYVRQRVERRTASVSIGGRDR